MTAIVTLFFVCLFVGMPVCFNDLWMEVFEHGGGFDSNTDQALQVPDWMMTWPEAPGPSTEPKFVLPWTMIDWPTQTELDLLSDEIKIVDLGHAWVPGNSYLSLTEPLLEDDCVVVDLSVLGWTEAPITSRSRRIMIDPS